MRSFLFLIIVTMTFNHLLGQENLGIFDNHGDVGEVENGGFAHYLSSDQTYIIGGAGENMWGTHDQFHYLWTTIQGDFILRAEVEFQGSGVDPHRKAGWIVRNDLKSTSPHVNAAVHGDGLVSLQTRAEDNGETTEVISRDSFPSVIQLERIGDTYIMSTAEFGKELTSVTIDSVTINDEAYVGLYVCSHNKDIVETAIFRNVRIVRLPDEDLVPYQEYIGSRLEIMEVATGHRKVLYSNSFSIQAPNWTIDGEKLIYNSKGLLYNYDLKSNVITPFNTGFATRNNNDHVLTFDGSMMGISHHNTDDGGVSSLYYLPGEGGSSPIKVTKEGVGASYLHGWSPDNKKMVFTGNRKGRYDIYSVDISNGQEEQLTDFSTLDDGPEYSPDGKYIFFNSVRTGTMQLWRMDSDGSNQVQLTFDGYNDWFPHVSPDKKWIAFISFPKDIDPSAHPFYKRCLLRIMPYEGGTPRVIGYIFGGQGSINVPSWSPDSKHIAFVTNSKI